PEGGIAFEAVSVSIKATLWRAQPQDITISADGTCVYRIEERPARGKQRRWGPARLVHKMDAKRMLKLQKLLEKTKWLTAPGGEGPALHTDAAEWRISVTRGGKTRAITCRGSRPEPYGSLMWFFRAVAKQENLLYRMNWVGGGRAEALAEILGHMEAYRGVSGKGYPLFDLDYRRYEPTFARVLAKPLGHDDGDLTAAIEVLTYLGRQEHRGQIVKLVRDRSRKVAAAAARSVVAMDAREAIPVLVDAHQAGGTDELAWQLIRFGKASVPTIARLIEQGCTDNDFTSGKLVRAYLDHWRELPGPLDKRIVAAARAGQAKSRHWLEYYDAFLELARTQPPPPGEAVCRVNQSGDVLRSRPVRLIYGWYVLADGKIVAHKAGPPAPPGTARFSLLLSSPRISEGKLEIQSGWRAVRAKPGKWPPPTVSEVARLDVPTGTVLKMTYWAAHPVKRANSWSAFRITKRYTTLWDGWVMQGDKPVRRLVYVARIADKADPVQTFSPPAAPPPGSPPAAGLRTTFRGLKLSESTRLTDPAVVHDTQVALKNHAIRSQGGKPRDKSRTTVIYKSPLKEAGGYHFIVYHDAKAKVFYIQVRLTRRSGRGSEFHGPFRGDPFETLKLKRILPPPTTQPAGASPGPAKGKPPQADEKKPAAHPAVRPGSPQAPEGASTQPGGAKPVPGERTKSRLLERASGMDANAAYVLLKRAFLAGRYEELEQALAADGQIRRRWLSEFRFAKLRARSAAARFRKFRSIGRSNPNGWPTAEDAKELRRLAGICTSAFEHAFRLAPSHFEQGRLYCLWNEMLGTGYFDADSELMRS
ncbi:hypothetical protein LCGC14_1898330, partial [marine sediment metagenome]